MPVLSLYSLSLLSVSSFGALVKSAPGCRGVCMPPLVRPEWERLEPIRAARNSADKASVVRELVVRLLSLLVQMCVCLVRKW